MKQEELSKLIEAHLCENLDTEGVKRLSDYLAQNAEARKLYLEMTDLHANLAVDESLWVDQPQSVEKTEVVSFSSFKSFIPWALAASVVFLLSLFLLPKHKELQTFALIKDSFSATWEGGDLTTAVGSRLADGNLHLAEGLATLKFDSGAEVTLEAPASIRLIDSMKCELTKGTAVTYVPDSALGFRIITPEADIVDYGTRFSVTVFEETGETHTRVSEGKVKVEYRQSDQIIELIAGQHYTIQAKGMIHANKGNHQELDTINKKPLEHGAGWTLFEPSKGAFVGRIPNHLFLSDDKEVVNLFSDTYFGGVHNQNSDVLLLVKNAISEGPMNRNAYMEFDLSRIDRTGIQEADLLLHFAPTGWGLASHLPEDCTFKVFGLTGEVPNWDEANLGDKFPGNPETVFLGSFVLPKGVQKGRFGVRTESLTTFLKSHLSSEISFMVMRETKETEEGGLVHGFASRRHPSLPAPTLAIRSTP
jgi:ferric-dicitrate binding protein FerR (iron transport regulator)